MQGVVFLTGWRAARPVSLSGKGLAGAASACSGSATGTGASRTSYTRWALRRTRWRYWTASGRPFTASNAARGVRTATAMATPESLPSWTASAATAAAATTVMPHTSAD
ncbi:hypothetical protein SF23_07465, partial [Streptomyces sp. MBRL 10]